MRRVFIFIILVSNFTCAQSQKKIDFLLGKWQICRTISADPSIPITQKESSECLDQIVIFLPDQIIGPKSPCIYEGCTNVTYKFKRVNALKYFNNDKKFLKTIGYHKNWIDVVETSCGVPFSNIRIYNHNLISMGADGYIYFLRRSKK
jgi:hypothetical protein